jgi:putative phage-type endonuclease
MMRRKEIVSRDSVILAKTDGLEHKEWLELRRLGIGGSDVGAIAGYNPWRSPIHVYLDKIGKGEEVEQNEPMYWGKVLEDVVAREFVNRTGLKVRRKNAILKSKKWDFMLANIDREIIGEKVGLECKTTNAFSRTAWEDGRVPEDYLLQCQHYMAVTGYEKWWIAVLIGGNSFVMNCIDRDNVMIEKMIELEENFWKGNVLAKNPPFIDGSDACTDLMKIMFPDSDKDSEIELSEDALSWIEQYERASLDEKDAKFRKDEAGNNIKYMLGENEIGRVGDRLVTWKGHIKSRFDSKRFGVECPDLYEQFVVKKNERRLNIK